MRLHVTDEGRSGDPDAPVVVLLCSLGSTVDSWEPQRRELGADHRVVAVDTRGHGGSPVVPGPVTVADLAADVLETLDALRIERAAIAGVSLGGAIAQRIALDAPERVTALALVCTSAFFGDPQPWLDRAATVRAEGTGAVADAVVARWFSADHAAAHPATVEAMRAMIASTPAEGYAACCEALASWDSRGELGSITAPTLVLAGTEDPATPPAHAEVLAAGIPGARLEVLEGAAHLAPYQQPGIVTALLAEHVKGSHS